MIQISSLEISLGSRVILSGVNAEIPPGLTCILGANGSGKTMLLRTLCALMPPSGGKVRLDDEDITTMSRNARARRIAYMPQLRPVPQIEARLLVEHARYPFSGFSKHIDEAGEEIVEQSLNRANALFLCDKMLTELSGGERQRVYVAAALAQGTDVLLLDEPTTYLDLNSQLELLRLLRSIGEEGKTVVAVMHDVLQAFSFAERVMLLDGGRMAFYAEAADKDAARALKSIYGCGISADERQDAVYKFRLTK